MQCHIEENIKISRGNLSILTKSEGQLYKKSAKANDTDLSLYIYIYVFEKKTTEN
jgi:hypothetical protein